LTTMVVGVIGFFVYAFVAEYAPLAACVWLALVVVATAFSIVGLSMPKRTLKGVTLTEKIKAFKRYLEHIDQYTQVAEAQDQFEKYLSYAIAFGLEKSWVAKFSQVDTPAPTWYVPYNPMLNEESQSDSNSAHSASGGGSLASSDASSAQEKERPGFSLDNAASGSFSTLNQMSAGLFGMLNSTADAFMGSSPSPEHEASGGGSSSFSSDSSSSSSSDSSSWSSSSSDSSSSWSSSSDSSSSSSDTGGGGSSDFG
jgi:hypothetical protein